MVPLGGNSISVFIVVFAYSKFERNKAMDLSTTLLLNFIFNTLNNDNNITRIIDSINI